MTNMPSLKTQDTGICNSCQTFNNCIYSGPTRHFDCNEYNPKEQSMPFKTENHIDLIPIDRLQGLCASCQHGAACTLKNSDMGVWHCEEYC